MGYSGAGGKLIHEKKSRSNKSCDTDPLTEKGDDETCVQPKVNSEKTEFLAFLSPKSREEVKILESKIFSLSSSFSWLSFERNPIQMSLIKKSLFCIQLLLFPLLLYNCYYLYYIYIYLL
jgi:hypothetical protein